MKIRLVGDELSRKDRHDEAVGRFPQICEQSKNE